MTDKERPTIEQLSNDKFEELAKELFLLLTAQKIAQVIGKLDELTIEDEWFMWADLDTKNKSLITALTQEANPIDKAKTDQWIESLKK